ncbi:MAG: deoxyribonuclease IV, partial [Gemmataceae bacterium]
MPLFGSHLSTAGGLHKAPLAARGYGFESVQLFTKAPGQWASKPIDDAQAELFRQTIRETKVQFPTVHDSYLINLA